MSEVVSVVRGDPPVRAKETGKPSIWPRPTAQLWSAGSSRVTLSASKIASICSRGVAAMSSSVRSRAALDGASVSGWSGVSSSDGRVPRKRLAVPMASASLSQTTSATASGEPSSAPKRACVVATNRSERMANDPFCPAHRPQATVISGASRSAMSRAGSWSATRLSKKPLCMSNSGDSCEAPSAR